MATTSVPAITWSSAGPVVPDESAIFDGAIADIDTAFGGGVNTTNLETPQGQLAQSTTAIVGAKNDDILEVVNGVDPATSAGRFQDGIARIYFIERNPAEPTALEVSCMGAVGLSIPLGALIADPNGNIYACTQAGVVPSSGSITLSFANQVTGPTPVPSSVSIYQAIPGWDNATLVSGVPGQNVESRADFEFRRQNSVAANSVGSVPSVRGRVLGVAGVLDAYVTDNPSGSPVTIGDYTLAANSLYVGVFGGAAQDIANAIWTKKSPGCNYNGNTSVTVYDSSVGSQPYPSYVVTFQTLTVVPILFAVQIVNNPNLPSNYVALIQNAIVAAFTGADGGSRARSGTTLYAGRYYQGAQAVDPSVEVLSIQLGTTTANQNSVVMGIDQTPTIAAANISVTTV